MPGVPVARINRLIAQPDITPTQDAVRQTGSQRFAIRFEHGNDSFAPHRG